ncbi:RICIN domain-containing protein [Streptomyces vilmorinianum]|uniref:RICIN domain-containing protein n=1 Tax=Streptomyces vilmorinianum TaxID=3051092 RepID=UPI0015866887|nr:RICIN domain-containing protein [Streptomyces vilmorinianum]
MASGLWGLTAPAEAAQQRPVGTGWYEVVARHSDKCLDVAWASPADGANVIQWGCSGQGNQQWRLIPQGDGMYQIVARHSRKCLDVEQAGVHSGANVIQWGCWGGTNQLWSFRTPDGRAIDRPEIGRNVKIVAEHSGRVLDVLDGSTADGANVIQWEPWDPGFNQQWRFRGPK